MSGRSQSSNVSINKLDKLQTNIGSFFIKKNKSECKDICIFDELTNGFCRVSEIKIKITLDVEASTNL